MNAPILKLFVVFMLLFGALAALTSWNTVLNAKAYRDNALNKRPLLAAQRIRRGTIRARDGELLARSVRKGGKSGFYVRRYTDAARQFAHAVGYDYPNTIGLAGLERSYDDALIGKRNELTSIIDELRGKRQQGDNVTTNLDPAAQRAAIAGLAGRKGAVVAIEPATGKVRVMVSTPGYDPRELADSRRLSQLQGDDANAPLVNRATQSGFPPGSTMKVVTATAALDTGRFTPDSVISGDSPKTISGVPLDNFGGKDFGPITLTTALTNSVNTVWAQVAEKLGRNTLNDYMRRFGFYSDPPLDYPDGQLIPSGVYAKKGLIEASSKSVDIGRVGIGQERLRVTPMQMAIVAATVANDGVLVKPRLADRVVDPDGRVVKDIGVSRGERVMKSSTARALNEMMGNVVREGSGTAAALQGIDVAGKTGTAELNLQGLNQPWFIGFAPQRAPKVAVAVTIQNVQGGQGGVDAAPIAKAVMQSLLGR
ncbi:MAG: penicillin-binding protein [Solirubrobacteraceae bacterium]|jgi:peptidoglycan glycosyltransferase|nr:penicillin-binding protein [Solirubrobacteraceae bacterium]